MEEEEEDDDEIQYVSIDEEKRGISGPNTSSQTITFKTAKDTDNSDKVRTIINELVECKELEKIVRGVSIPSNSGYSLIENFGNISLNDTLPSTIDESIVSKVEDGEVESKKERVGRFVRWQNVNACPNCGGLDLFRYNDVSKDRLFIECNTIPKAIYSDIESLIKGDPLKKPSGGRASVSTDKNSSLTKSVTTKTKKKKQGLEIPSPSVIPEKKVTLKEYLETVQERICGWSISM